jgi:flagellar biosynthesis activator protein FlaF
MEQARTTSTAELLEALRRNWRLWTIFQVNLVDAQCPLPAPVRGNLIGLSNFIDRHTASLLANPDPAKVEVLVNINRQIAEGLLEGQRSAAANAATNPPAPTPSNLRETA